MAEQANNNEQAELHFNPAVYVAAKHGNLDDLVTAVAARPNLIDTPHPNDFRRTPLSVAAMKGHVGVVAKLIELGSQAIDIPNDFGVTPVCAAALAAHVSVIETLVRLGSKAIDTPSIIGWTPLHVAANNGHVSAIEALVRLGSKAIDTPDKYGRTPLQLAAHENKPECLKTLVALGAEASSLQIHELPAQMVEHLFAAQDEEYAAEVRFRVYFGESLVHRLLFGGTVSLRSSFRMQQCRW